MPVSSFIISTICPSLEQGISILEDDVPELLDFTEELLLESVDGLDFAELLLDPFDSADAPLRVTLEEEDSSSMLRDDSSSCGAKLLSSSPHAT